MGDPYRVAVAEAKLKGNASLAEKHENSTSIEDMLESLAELVVEEQAAAAEEEGLEGANSTNVTKQTNTTTERPRPLPSEILPGAW